MIEGKPLENLKPPCLFASRFEEEKVKGYLRNLIASTFVENRPLQCFHFAATVLGDEAMLGFMEKLCPDILEKPELLARLEDDDWGKLLPRAMRIKILRCGVDPYLSQYDCAPVEPVEFDLQGRLSNLRKAFRLTDAEIEILTFIYLLTTCLALRTYLFVDNQVADFSTGRIFLSHGHMLLGVSRNAFLEAFAGERLLKTNLLHVPGECIALTSWCEQYLSGFSGPDLSLEFFFRDNEETLRIGDFDISDQERQILASLLADDRGHNLLFYGAPGTGKTSLAHSLAKAHGKELYTVKIPESVSPNERLTGIYATLNIAPREALLILIDEADELLNAASSDRFESKMAKSWINSILEGHHHKIIWITNRSDEIEPSTMRRFSFALRFSRFSDERRLKVMHYELKKLGLENTFPETDLRQLCRTYRVNADGIVKAAGLAALHEARGPEAALTVMETVLRNHAEATSLRGTARLKVREFSRYSLEGLNTSQDMGTMITILEKYLGQHRGKPAGPMSLLFYGLPGSGKTEFVYYLGERLGKDVLLKRASDIISKFVGETETTIARAFEEAQDEGKMLFFDEADSFLFPRSEAQRSWEKSFTNEILSQLQDYEGIVVFATNMIDGLDHAALRRFRFKIEFRPLTPSGKLLLYTNLLAPLLSDAEPTMEPTTEEIALLESIPDLTPGDFAVVREQHLYVDPSQITHEALIKSLARESTYKVPSRRTIGFACGNEQTKYAW